MTVVESLGRGRLGGGGGESSHELGGSAPWTLVRLHGSQRPLPLPGQT